MEHDGTFAASDARTSDETPGRLLETGNERARAIALLESVRDGHRADGETTVRALAWSLAGDEPRGRRRCRRDLEPDNAVIRGDGVGMRAN